MTQKQQILEHLFEYNTITSLEAIQEYGITRLAARIAQLREDGFKIVTTIKNGKNRYGKTVTYAEYSFGKASGDER